MFFFSRALLVDPPHTVRPSPALTDETRIETPGQKAGAKRKRKRRKARNTKALQLQWTEVRSHALSTPKQLTKPSSRVLLVPPL